MKTKFKSITCLKSGKVLIISTIQIILFFVSFSGIAQQWTLEQCIDSAQVYNKNLQIAKNNTLISAEREREAKAGLAPKISFGADYRYYVESPYQLMPLSTFNPASPEGEFREVQFGVPHNINASLQFAMPVYNPQVYGSVQVTRVAKEISELQYERTGEQVFFEVSNLYYTALILHHQLAYIDSNLVNNSKLLNNLELLYLQQMIKKSDVTRVCLQRDQLQTRRDMVISNIGQALNALKLSIGIPITREINIQTAISFQSGLQYVDHQSVDLSLAGKQSLLLSGELNALKKSRLPSVNFIGSFMQTGFGYDTEPNQFLKFFPVGFAGLQISYPLFNGTVTRRKINQKKIEIQNSNLHASFLEEQNKMGVMNATNKRTFAEKNIIDINAQIGLAATIYRQLLLEKENGTADLTEVLMADNALNELQQDYISALVEYFKADLELKKLTGNITFNKQN